MSLDSIPVDVFRSIILPHLDVTTLGRLACTNKRLRDVVSVDADLALCRMWTRRYTLHTCLVLSILGRNVRMAQGFYEVSSDPSSAIWDASYNLTRHTLITKEQRASWCPMFLWLLSKPETYAEFRSLLECVTDPGLAVEHFMKCVGNKATETESVWRAAGRLSSFGYDQLWEKMTMQSLSFTWGLDVTLGKGLLHQYYRKLMLTLGSGCNYLPPIVGRASLAGAEEIFAKETNAENIAKAKAEIFIQVGDAVRARETLLLQSKTGPAITFLHSPFLIGSVDACKVMDEVNKRFELHVENLIRGGVDCYDYIEEQLRKFQLHATEKSYVRALEDCVRAGLIGLLRSDSVHAQMFPKLWSGDYQGWNMGMNLEKHPEYLPWMWDFIRVDEKLMMDRFKVDDFYSNAPKSIRVWMEKAGLKKQ